MERKNDLGLDSNDLENLDEIQEDLMNVLAKLMTEEWTARHIADFHMVTGYANFITGGIIYKNGLDLCAGHEQDDDDDEDD